MSLPDLQSLRRHLREKFPDAHRAREAESHPVASSLPALPKGAPSELSPAPPANGLTLVLAQLLQDPKSNIHPPQADPTSLQLALIDGRDSFDPASHGPEACSRLLWIRCHHAAESLRCTDLLLRDGNLPLLVLDLQLNPLRELRDIPSSSWYRLRNLARQSGATLLAFTPQPLIPAATLRLTFSSSLKLGDLENANAHPENAPHRHTPDRPGGTIHVHTSDRPGGTIHVSRGLSAHGHPERESSIA